MKWLYKLDKLKILGKTYTVVYEGSPYFEPDVQPDVKMGMCDTIGQIIHLYEGQQPDALLEVLLHECIHAIDGEMRIKLEDVDVCRLAAGMQAVIMENFILGRKTDE